MPVNPAEPAQSSTALGREGTCASGRESWPTERDEARNRFDWGKSGSTKIVASSRFGAKGVSVLLARLTRGKVKLCGRCSAGLGGLCTDDSTGPLPLLFASAAALTVSSRPLRKANLDGSKEGAAPLAGG